MLERIYNFHYSNGAPAVFTCLLVLPNWKLNITALTQKIIYVLEIEYNIIQRLYLCFSFLLLN